VWARRPGCVGGYVGPRIADGGEARVPAHAPSHRGDQRQRAHEDDEVGQQPESTSGRRELPLEELDLRDGGADHPVLRGNRLGRDRLVERQVDRHRGQRAPVVDAQHGLPGAVQGHRLGRPVFALTDALQRADQQSVALPRGDLDPGRVVDEVCRVEVDDDVRRALLGLHLIDDECGPQVVGNGGDQPVRHAGGEGHQAADEDRARHRRPHQPTAQTGGEQCAEQPPRHAAHQGHESALDEDVASPRQGLHQVRPGGLGGVSGRTDRSSSDRTEQQRPAGQGQHQREQLHHDRRAEVQGERRQHLPEERSDEQRDRAPDGEEEGDGGQRPAAADEYPGGDQRHTGGPGDHEGLQHQPELRDVEVVLGLEDRQPQQQSPHGRRLPDEPRGPADLAVAVVRGQAAMPLLLQHEQPDEGQPRPRDEHQVRRAPEGDVLTEEPVPHVVEREAEQRVGACCGDQDAAHGHVPATDEPDGGRPGPFVERHRAGQYATRENTEEPDENQVVRGIGQRALVAADTDVQRDVLQHAEESHEQGDRGKPGGQRDPRRHTGGRSQPAACPREHRGAPGAVEEHHAQQQGGQAQTESGRRDDLTECGPSGGTGLVGQQHVCSDHGAMQHLRP
jgi:hypothetical protein